MRAPLNTPSFQEEHTAYYHPRRGFISVEKGSHFTTQNPRRGFISNRLPKHYRIRHATPHGVVGHNGNAIGYRYESPDGLYCIEPQGSVHPIPSHKALYTLFRNTRSEALGQAPASDYGFYIQQSISKLTELFGANEDVSNA